MSATLFDSLSGRPCILSCGSGSIGMVKETTWIKGELHIHAVWPQEQAIGNKGKVRRWLADATYSEQEIRVLEWPEAIKMKEQIKPLINTILSAIGSNKQ